MHFRGVINDIKPGIKLKLNEIRAITRYRYIFRQTAIEIFKHGGGSILFNFEDFEVRENVYEYLEEKCTCL